MHRGVAAVVLMVACILPMVSGVLAGPMPADPPATLRETGLYADFDRRVVDPANIAFAPQYPLWTDGAVKRRWVRLPPGTVINASDPDAWVFPAGTRFWKEFAFGGRPVETRYIERLPDGQWLFVAYVWSAGRARGDAGAGNGPARRLSAVGGGRSHAIPAVSDCHVCHGTGSAPILGFGLLQLSPDRDPGGAQPRSGDP